MTLTIAYMPHIWWIYVAYILALAKIKDPPVSRRPPKCHHLFLGLLIKVTKNFIKIIQLFTTTSLAIDLFCSQTDRKTPAVTKPSRRR